MRGMRAGLAFLAIALAVGLALSGCRSSKPKPEMEVNLEQKGESLAVQVKLTNFRVPGDGHVHIRLDGGPEVMAYSNTYTIPKVEKGKHQVQVELSDVQHNYLGVKQVKEIEIK